MSYIGKKPVDFNDVTEAKTFEVTSDLTTPSINSGQIGGRRNIVINGKMQVAQRGSLTGQTGVQMAACDRFIVAEAGSTIVDTSQSTDVPSGQGFANSLKIDVTTADASLAADDFFLIITRLEGQDVQHLLYGTSGAKDLTVSFWVKSPKTGTHILELKHNDASYHNSQAYTITSANTWQKVELTFSGYTTTAFDNDTNHSLGIDWFLAAGSTYSGGTLNSNTWHNTDANRAVGQVNCVDSDANNFYITGVQLEVGSVATEFEHRTLTEELALCRRYFYKNTSNTVAFQYRGDYRLIQEIYPTEMRANPTVSVTEVGGAGTFSASSNASAQKISQFTAASSTSTTTHYVSAYTADAEI